MSQSDEVVPLEERVKLLFATVVDDDGTQVSTTTVAQSLSETLGRTVPPRELDALHRQGAPRASADLLGELARYFDMPESFLSDDPGEYYSSFRQLSLLIVQRDKKIPFVALRASSDRLGDNALQELQSYLESLG